ASLALVVAGGGGLEVGERLVALGGDVGDALLRRGQLARGRLEIGQRGVALGDRRVALTDHLGQPRVELLVLLRRRRVGARAPEAEPGDEREGGDDRREGHAAASTAGPAGGRVGVGRVLGALGVGRVRRGGPVAGGGPVVGGGRVRRRRPGLRG